MQPDEEDGSWSDRIGEVLRSWFPGTFVLLAVGTSVVALFPYWQELVRIAGAQAAFWSVGILIVLAIAGSAVWKAAQGHNESAFRRGSLAVGVALALLAGYHWPEMRETRLRDIMVEAESRLEYARNSPNNGGEQMRSLLVLERDFAIAQERYRYDLDSRTNAHPGGIYLYASIALILSLVWFGIALAGRAVYAWLAA